MQVGKTLGEQLREEYEPCAEDGRMCRLHRREPIDMMLNLIRNLHPAQSEYLDNSLEGFSLDQWREMEEGRNAR